MATFNARNYEQVQSTLLGIEKLLNITDRPEIGIICGSGLGKIAEIIEIKKVLPYSKLPNLPTTKIVGHKGELIYGKLRNKTIICFNGRFHSYEHNMDLALCSITVRIMHHLGAKVLIATSACGGINTAFNVCDFMLVKDHVFMPGLAGFSPLVGLDERFGPRFVSLHDAYDGELRKLALQVAKEAKITLHEGVYVMSGGSQFETPSEVRLYQKIGADVLGMSVCHETTVARQLNMKVVAFALITNVSKPEVEDAEEITHEEVLSMGDKASTNGSILVANLIEQINLD